MQVTLLVEGGIIRWLLLYAVSLLLFEPERRSVSVESSFNVSRLLYYYLMKNVSSSLRLFLNRVSRVSLWLSASIWKYHIICVGYSLEYITMEEGKMRSTLRLCRSTQFERKTSSKTKKERANFRAKTRKRTTESLVELFRFILLSTLYTFSRERYCCCFTVK